MLSVRHPLNLSNFAIVALTTACLFSSNAQASQITLTSNNNTVATSSNTLEVDWNGLSVNSAALTVDSQPQKATNLVIGFSDKADSAKIATWTLVPSGINVKAELNQDQLTFQFSLPSNIQVKRNKPIELAWFDLAEQQTQTLFLPFSEGMRVPTDNKLWASYLVGNHSGSNTTQDLKMPFWTVQQNNHFISYQMVNATNNQLFFSDASSNASSNTKTNFEYVKQRAQDIMRFGNFNSLFLDVDATAMAREDYRVSIDSNGNTNDESDMLSAFNNRMKWLSEQPSLVLGSEDGNSLTTKGIAFAHGLETVGFGWTDKDMKENRQSPYYLGRWYPDHKPDFFFKPAEVKEPYKSLLFSPQYRIPLYQAVFHDEVINTHHWHSDSLKFTNVQAERDLTAMLYNTPPMVHLTRDEALSSSSQRIKALKHYQDGFEPMHEQLWDKQLVDFEWLVKNGDVQQTKFSDGSKIIANFSDQTFHQRGLKVSPSAIKAVLSNGQTLEWKSEPN
ncbi:hypothetical protein FCV55_05390 [Vibrio sp. F13]|uniref:glycoside hydrolase n=1 Tax=Vibrio sp. F13 TaxID=2070777 RepID=UPI0010BE0057|nr:glycoside hydrolase [Vibrio sp. F13]TKF72579.1 hypothetical protein FCV55_05390 [Vibrio sp. F13]